MKKALKIVSVATLSVAAGIAMVGVTMLAVVQLTLSRTSTLANLATKSS